MTNEALPGHLTLRQVSELLKVHPSTLRNWDKNGTLKSIRIGVRMLRRYKKVDIAKFTRQKSNDE